MELCYVLNGGKYGGKDISVLGERYDVKREGSRSLVNVPEAAAPLLEAHGFWPTHISTGKMVELAVAAEKREAEQRKTARITEMLESGVSLDQLMAKGADGVMNAPANVEVMRENAELKLRLAAIEEKIGAMTPAADSSDADKKAAKK
jgi:hypothetical protein